MSLFQQRVVSFQPQGGLWNAGAIKKPVDKLQEQVNRTIAASKATPPANLFAALVLGGDRQAAPSVSVMPGQRQFDSKTLATSNVNTSTRGSGAVNTRMPRSVPQPVMLVQAPAEPPKREYATINPDQWTTEHSRDGGRLYRNTSTGSQVIIGKNGRVLFNSNFC